MGVRVFDFHQDDRTYRYHITAKPALYIRYKPSNRSYCLPLAEPCHLGENRSIGLHILLEPKVKFKIIEPGDRWLYSFAG